MSEPAKTFPCGHSLEQAAWLGCTDEECRPEDARISREYLASKGKKGARPGGLPSGWREA